MIALLRFVMSPYEPLVDQWLIDFSPFYVPAQTQYFRGKFTQPTFAVQTPMQNAVEREISRVYFQQVRVVACFSTTSTSAPRQHQHHLNISTTSTSASPQHQHHLTISTTSPSAPPQHQHHLTISTTSPPNSFLQANRTMGAWEVALKLFAHPPYNRFNIVGQIAGPLIFAANMFAFVTLVRFIHSWCTSPSHTCRPFFMSACASIMISSTTCL